MVFFLVHCAACEKNLKLRSDNVMTWDDEATQQSGYTFRCPTCRVTSWKSVPPHVLGLLFGGGARTATRPVIAEIAEPKPGAALCLNDLLTFHFELEGDDVLERIMASARDRQLFTI